MKGVAHAATTLMAAKLRRTACSIGVLALGRAALDLVARCTKWRAFPRIGVCLAPHCGRVPRGMASHASVGINPSPWMAPRTCNPLADRAYFNAGKLPHGESQCASIASRNRDKELTTCARALSLGTLPFVGAPAGTGSSCAAFSHMVCNGSRASAACAPRVEQNDSGSTHLVTEPQNGAFWRLHSDCECIVQLACRDRRLGTHNLE